MPVRRREGPDGVLQRVHYLPAVGQSRPPVRHCLQDDLHMAPSLGGGPWILGGGGGGGGEGQLQDQPWGWGARR